MTTTLVEGPDPRFGMLAPITKSASVTTPGGLTYSVSTTSSAVLSDPSNPLSLTSLTYSTVVNSRPPATSVYQAASRTRTTTSPAGRQGASVLDTLGRLVQAQFGGLAPASYSFDQRGRLASAGVGNGAEARTATYAYNPEGYLQTATDPLGRTVRFT